MPRTFSRNGPTRGEDEERGGGVVRGERKKGKKKKRKRRKTEAKTIGQSAYGLIRVPTPFRVSCEDDRPRNLIEGSFPFCFSRNVSLRRDFVTELFGRVNSLGNDCWKFGKSLSIG